jgi:hypothetical protein
VSAIPRQSVVARAANGSMGPVKPSLAEVPAETDRRDLVCRECGYGIRDLTPAPRCPMCRSFDWLSLTARGRVARFELERRSL